MKFTSRIASKLQRKPAAPLVSRTFYTSWSFLKLKNFILFLLSLLLRLCNYAIFEIVARWSFSVLSFHRRRWARTNLRRDVKKIAPIWNSLASALRFVSRQLSTHLHRGLSFVPLCGFVLLCTHSTRGTPIYAITGSIASSTRVIKK